MSSTSERVAFAGHQVQQQVEIEVLRQPAAPGHVSVRRQSILDLPRESLTALATSAGADGSEHEDVPPGLVVQSVEVIEAEIEPATLRPRSVVITANVRMGDRTDEIFRTTYTFHWQDPAA